MKVTTSKEEFLKKNQNKVFKEGSKQVLLIAMDDQVFAIDNRCPHEGYPLSEGTTSSGDSKECLLTCNWHNWKFDLKSGKCLIGGDNVRTYPVEDRGDSYVVDLSDPTPEQVQEMILEGFEVAFKKRQYGRISREVSRLHFNGLDPLVAVKKAILWSHDKFEFGMSHAYAAMADWLALYHTSSELEDKMICLTETIDHISDDSLRHDTYAYNKTQVPFSEEALLKAIEEEDLEKAESLVFSKIQESNSLKSLEEVLLTAALEHYNDFGHSLIYVEKAIEACGYLKDPEIDMALGLCLVRSLCYTTREDLIPEFKNYGYTVAKLKKLECAEKTKIPKELPKVTVNKSLEWLIENYPKYGREDLYDEVLNKNALNFLKYDLKFQSATDNPVTKNVGWLSFTHAITFSNAVRRACEKYPHLFPAGIAQMICFYGRNTAFTDPEIQFEDWKIEDEGAFKESVLATVFDHGLRGPILSAHIIKTGFAIFEEAQSCSEETKKHLFASLNRFLNSPLKQKHVRRIVSQGIKLVAQDFKDKC